MSAIPRGQRASTIGRIAAAGLAVTALGLLLAGSSATHVAAQANTVGGEHVTLEGNLTDVQFLAGRTVEITANVSDDVFAAGNDVTFRSATVKNAIAAGYDVEQQGGTAIDMFAVAANLTIAGTVDDDVLAAARNLRISTDGMVGGDARLAAETIDIDGKIGGSLKAAARRININGEISGKVDLIAERIVIGPNARITGDLIYRSRSAPEIADGAVISGEVRKVAVEVPDTRAIGMAILGIGIVMAIAWTVATLVLVVIVQLAVPGLMAGAVTRLQARPLAHLGGGIAGLLIAGVLTGILFISILGIPLGGAMAMLMAIMVLLGFMAVSLCIGLFIRRALRGPFEIETAGRVGWAIVGAVILGIVSLIPFLGGLINALAVAAGVGAASAEAWKRLRTA